MTINKKFRMAIVLAGLLPVLSMVATADVSIIGPSDSWKFLDTGNNDLGSTNGANSALTNWTTVDFDDSAWMAGAQPLGYGDPDIVTTNNYGGVDTNKFTTTYYRKTFQMASLAGVKSLRLALRVDDGAIVYVNGRSVQYVNFTITNEVNYLTFAPVMIDESVTNYVDISPNVLMVGSNTIAVEVHQAGLTSSDLRMWATLDQLDLSAEPTDSTVGEGANWYYLDDGSDQGTNWYASSFNASSWNVGPAPLAYMKISAQTNGNLETYLDYGPDIANKYVTTYFRRSFVVNNPAFVTSVVVNAQIDDGVVLYLNGQVVTNIRTTSSMLLYTNYALGGSSDGQVWESISVSPSMLVAGTNVWAAELHNVTAGSSDLKFNLTSSVLTSPGGLAAIYITTADQTVGNEVTAVQVDGSNSAFIVGDMMWTNSLGGSGSFVASNPWTIVSIPLMVGSNVITVSGTNAVGTLGYDMVTIVRQQLSAFVDVTTTNSSVSSGTAAFNVSGTNGVTIVGDMWWTNSPMGGAGMFAASSPWEVEDVPLVEGTNMIIVYGTNMFGVIASDMVTVIRASIYGDDMDADAMPDFWETRFFGDNTNAVAGDDTDGDGQSNWEEYLAGTMPNDSNSLFMMTYIYRNGITNELHWIGGTNGSPRPYVLLSTTGDITNSFGVRNPSIGRTEGTNIYIETSGTTPRFYKVQATN